jgi:flagellar L-ring protein precursor FlgH
MLKISRTTLSAVLLASTLLSGCSQTLDELHKVGNPPPLAKVDNPDAQPGYKPMTWPMPENAPPQKQYANSLWQAGARTFFRDQRAARVGDILKVRIIINDQAQIQNNTERKRQGTDQVNAPAVFGLQNKLMHFLPGAQDNPANLLNATSTTDSKGTGTIQRKEQITTAVPALITQVLPNGNFVIDGKQEILINFDIREVSIKGVVRPEDIHSDNTVDSTQVAEARIVYGGHGQLMDVQQPRWGAQVVETLSPF